MNSMAFTASKVAGGPMVTNRANIIEPCGTINSLAKPVHHNGLTPTCQRVEFCRPGCGRLMAVKLIFSSEASWHTSGKPCTCAISRQHSVLCHSRESRNIEAKERLRHSDDFGRDEEVHEDLFGSLSPEQSAERNSTYSSQGLGDFFKYVYNDAKFVNERARNDIVLLSRGIMRLNDRACQDVAVLGSEFLKLDARAREDTEKIDHGVKKKAERLHHIATILKNKAQTKLKSVADQHWNDGALESKGVVRIIAHQLVHFVNNGTGDEADVHVPVARHKKFSCPWSQADLRRADLLAKRRAMEDAFMALEFVKNIHDMMVSNMYKFPLDSKEGSLSANDIRSIMLEKNGRTAEYFPGEISSDRITAIQEAYWSMASALSEADGIDYTDPEELELLVTTLIDLDAMDGKSSVSLLVECSSSPDASTRQALANALAAAPSMWTLGNAGMGALQRLAEDENPAIAAAASRTIKELKKQWEIEEGDSWRFMMNQKAWKEETEHEEDDNKDVEKD